MDKYECPCSYVYDPAVGDPDNGIAPGTAFEDIPEDWVCPVCGLGKDAFEKVEYEAKEKRSGTSGAFFYAHRITLMRVPISLRDSTSKRPPCRSTIHFAMARPSPVPPLLLARESSAR